MRTLKPPDHLLRFQNIACEEYFGPSFFNIKTNSLQFQFPFLFWLPFVFFSKKRSSISIVRGEYFVLNNSLCFLQEMRYPLWLNIPKYQDVKQMYKEE